MIAVVVHAISLSSASSRLFELRGLEGPLPPFKAGAHVDLRLGSGLIRQYSLCNPPNEGHRYLICVKREPLSRGGSAGLHDGVAVGDRLEVSTPRNAFGLDPTASRHILMAGGIGVTPLVAMAHALREAGTPFELHHYARRPQDTPLLEILSTGPLADRYTPHHSSAGDSARTGLPPPLRKHDPAAAVYVCGPPEFNAGITALAREEGWREDQIHSEKFTAASASPPTEADGDTFYVQLARSGERLAIPPERTIAEVLLEHGVEVDLSCEQGICGACLTPVLAGDPDHRDEIQTPEERSSNTHLTVCCSRSRSKEMVLDL